MTNNTSQTIGDSLNIIWTIASKDIADALKNRVAISMIIMLSIILLVPKMLPYIFDQPETVLPIYDMDDSPLIADLKKAPNLSVQVLRSEQELRQALCSSIYPEIGLLLPTDFGPLSGAGEEVEFQGFACWSKRHQVPALQPRLEELLSQALGQPVSIRIEGNIVYPSSEGILALSLININSVIMILMKGFLWYQACSLKKRRPKPCKPCWFHQPALDKWCVGKLWRGHSTSW
jgi:hypothetical protein